MHNYTVGVARPLARNRRCRAASYAKPGMITSGRPVHRDGSTPQIRYCIDTLANDCVRVV